MYQPTAAKSETQYGTAPSMVVSLTLAALTVGLVAVASVVAAAPAVVGAFGAGAVTAAVATVAHRVHTGSSSTGTFAGRRSAHR